MRKHSNLFMCHLVLVLASPFAVSLCPDDALWCEEFDEQGPPNPLYWSYDIGRGTNGWGNDEFQKYKEENVKVDQGLLKIQASKDGNNYSSGRIKTESKVSFQFVTLEASITIPNLEGGLWPAFWLLGTTFPEVGWPECGEIDIAEWGSLESVEAGDSPRRVTSAFHWPSDEKYEGTEVTIPATATGFRVASTPLHEGFHRYKMDWTPTRIITYIDDEIIFDLDITDIPAYHKPQFLLINLAVGGRFTGNYSPTTEGGEMLVDWVRAYDNGFGSTVEVASLDPSSAEFPKLVYRSTNALLSLVVTLLCLMG